MDKCEYCGSEMYLMEEDDWLGTSSYDCSNEECDWHYSTLVIIMITENGIKDK